jgi:hypothetical protein
VAYRQLCAVTFAMLGWAAVACGGGTATNARPDATEEQPPTNGDQAPNDTDTASNTDQPPANSDSPPNNAGEPAGSGGGRLEQLCKRICDTIETLAEDCSDGMTDVGMGDACSAEVNCQIPPSTPCQDEIADAFDCIFANLAIICSDEPGQGPGQGPAARPCNDVAKRLTDCARDNGLTDPPDDNGNGNGNDPPPSCTPMGGCECATECLTCGCEAGNDLEELQACGTGACAQQ